MLTNLIEIVENFEYLGWVVVEFENLGWVIVELHT